MDENVPLLDGLIGDAQAAADVAADVAAEVVEEVATSQKTSSSQKVVKKGKKVEKVDDPILDNAHTIENLTEEDADEYARKKQPHS